MDAFFLSRKSSVSGSIPNLSLTVDTRHEAYFFSTGVRMMAARHINSQGLLEKNTSLNPRQKKMDLVLFNKKKNLLDFDVPLVLQSENERDRKDKEIFGSCPRTKKSVKHEGDTIYKWSTWNGPQKLGKKTRRIGSLWVGSVL